MRKNIFNLKTADATFEGRGGGMIPGDSFDVPANQVGNIPVRPFVEKFVAPRLQQMGIDNASGYTYEIFGNLARLESGLDKRRETDSPFYLFGPQIKAKRDEAVRNYANQGRHPLFVKSLDELTKLLAEYYQHHSASGKIVKRDIPKSQPPKFNTDNMTPQAPKKSPSENYNSIQPLNPNYQRQTAAKYSVFNLQKIADAPSNQWDYKGHKCDIYLDYEDDNIKAYHTVVKPDGQSLYPNITPYDKNPGTVNLWIDAGYPENPNGMNWDLQSLQQFMRQRQSPKTAGYSVVSPIDKDKYPQRPGLEGPFPTKSGKVVYYDPKGQIDPSQAPGMYYDPSADMYITNEEYEALNADRPNPHLQPRNNAMAKTNVFRLKTADYGYAPTEWDNKSPEDVYGKHAVTSRSSIGHVYIDELFDTAEEAQADMARMQQKYPQEIYSVVALDSNFPHEIIMSYFDQKAEEAREDMEDASFNDPDDPIYDSPVDGVGFRDPGGNSALRAETEDNPRNLPCPNCGRENMLTQIDANRGYQCDSCADQAEGHYGSNKKNAITLKTSQFDDGELSDPGDDALKSAGWTESHGIGLWTNPANPLVCIDNNSEVLVVYPVGPEGAFETSPDDFLEMFNTTEEALAYVNNLDEKTVAYIKSKYRNQQTGQSSIIPQASSVTNLFTLKTAQFDLPPGFTQEPAEPSRPCSRCRQPKDDVLERYSFGIYAGKMCDDCAYRGYRDHCGLVRNPDGTYSEGRQGDPNTLDEQVEPNY